MPINPNDWALAEQKFLKLALESTNPKLADHYLKMAARASQEKHRAATTVERKQSNRDRRLIAIRKWN